MIKKMALMATILLLCTTMAYAATTYTLDRYGYIEGVGRASWIPTVYNFDVTNARVFYFHVEGLPSYGYYMLKWEYDGVTETKMSDKHSFMDIGALLIDPNPDIINRIKVTFYQFWPPTNYTWAATSAKE